MARPTLEVPVVGKVQGAVDIPGSKSYTNRAIMCACLADGRSVLRNASSCEDTRLLTDALGEIAFTISEARERKELIVEGLNGEIPARRANLDLGNAGTSIRFLMSFLALSHGDFVLDGDERMRQRPVDDLIVALNHLGCRALSVQNNGCPPVVIVASGLRGGRVEVSGDRSSQFVSSLLLAAPYASAPLDIAVRGKMVSRPYIQMTLQTMAAFGVEVEEAVGKDEVVYRVRSGQGYRAATYKVEPDASGATYFWALAAITGGTVSTPGFQKESLQADIRFLELLAQMGAQVKWRDGGVVVTGGELKGIDADLGDLPDAVPTLAVTALFAKGPTTIRGVPHLRIKESDRIASLRKELEKLGASVEEREDGLEVRPGTFRGATIETYNDHRIAMSFAIAGAARGGVRVEGPSCVEKSFPDFFDRLMALRS